MGKVYSVALKRVNRFNIESRTEKVIAKEKPIAAPKHAKTQQFLKDSVDRKQFIENEAKKNQQLDNYLKKVYLTSTSKIVPNPDSSKKLPHERGTVEDFEYGALEPPVVPEGKATLKQALEFITGHQQNPKVYTAEYIAKEYKIEQAKIETILQYYKTFLVYIPEVPTNQKTPILSRFKSFAQLPGKKKNEE